MLRKIIETFFGKPKPAEGPMKNLLSPELVIEQLKEHSQLCVQVIHSNSGNVSKLGGLPSLPKEFEWPSWNGAPLQFLCQFDLKEAQAAAPIAWLPQNGLILFFYDTEQSTWGFDPNDKGSWKVFYFSADVELEPASLSSSVGGENTLPEVFVRFESYLSVPDPERIALESGQIHEAVWDFLDKSRSDNSSTHQIGGWPNSIQSDAMELECQLASNGVYLGNADGYQSDIARKLASGKGQWRLLLQLDSDESAGMQWGDVGRLYFWVRETDSLKGDFSEVWMIFQCY